MQLTNVKIGTRLKQLGILIGIILLGVLITLIRQAV